MDRDQIKKIPREQLEEMYLKKEESERRATDNLRWVHQLMSNTSADSDEKIVAYWTRFHMKRKESREDGLFHIPNGDIIKDSGIDDKKMGKVLKKLEDMRVISRDLKKIRDDFGHVTGSENWMVLDGSVLVNPGAIDFGKNTKHGGVRKPRCETCKSENVKVETKKRIVCCEPACGEVHEDKEWTLRRGCDDDLNLEPDEEVF